MARGWLVLVLCCAAAAVAPGAGAGPPAPLHNATAARRRLQGDACSLCAMEAGTAVGVTHEWHTVTTEQSYTNPVLLTGVVTMVGTQDATARAEITGPNAFRIRMVEASCMDGSHAGEQLSWMIMEASVGPLGEAGRLDFGTGSPGLSGHTTKIVGKVDVAYSEPRSSPVVIVSIMSAVEDNFYNARINRPGNNDFQLVLQEEEVLDNTHVPETIGWLAVDTGQDGLQSAGGMQWWAGTTGNFDEEGRNEGSLDGGTYHNVNFGGTFASRPHVFATIKKIGGADPCMLRTSGWTTSQLPMFVAEDTCDGETNHAAENAGVLAVAPVATSLGNHDNDCSLSCTYEWVSVEPDLQPPQLVSGCHPVTLFTDPGQNAATLGSGCPPAFPHPSPPHNDIICYDAEGYATAGSGPCGSWCTLDVAVGSGCGPNENYLCATVAAELFLPDHICGAYAHTSESLTAVTSSPEACATQVLAECGNKEFFTWRSENNACHCVEEPSCDSPTSNSGLNVYRITHSTNALPQPEFSDTGGTPNEDLVYHVEMMDAGGSWAEVTSTSTFHPAAATQIRWTVTDAMGNAGSCETSVTAVQRDNEPPQLQPGGCDAVVGTTDADQPFATATFGAGFGSGSGLTLPQPVFTDNSGGSLQYSLEVYDTAAGGWVAPTSPIQFPYTPGSAMPGCIVTDVSPAACPSCSPDGGYFLIADSCFLAKAPGAAPGDAIVMEVEAVRGGSTIFSGAVRLWHDNGNNPQDATMTIGRKEPSDATAAGDWAVGDYVVFPSEAEPGSTQLPGTQIRWTVTDTSGNAASCETLVIITDDQNPSIDSGCEDVSGTTDDGQNYGTIGQSSLALPQPVFTDNSGETLTYTKQMGTANVDDSSQFLYALSQAEPNGAHGQSHDGSGMLITTVTWTATDSTGLSASCTLSVTIADDEQPVLTSCAALDVQATTDVGAPFATIAAGDLSLVYPSATDNSGEDIPIVASVLDIPVAASTEFPYVGPSGTVATTLTFSATDLSGQVSTCDVSVTVHDDEDPQALCDAVVVGNTASQQNYGTLAEGVQLQQPTASDNSGEALTTIISVDGTELQDNDQFAFVGSGLASEWQLDVSESTVSSSHSSLASQLPPGGLFGSSLAVVDSGTGMIAIGAPRGHYNGDLSECSESNPCPGTIWIWTPPSEFGHGPSLGQLEEWCPSELAACRDDSAGSDLTVPTDTVSPTSENSPINEHAALAVDGDDSTKYLNFDVVSTGLTVVTSPGIVTQLALTSANDGPERDPASFVLSGLNDDGDFEQIAAGAVPTFPDRLTRQVISFVNEHVYSSYRLVFPSVTNEAEANSMQIAEVELLTSCYAELSVALSSSDGPTQPRASEFAALFQCAAPQMRSASSSGASLSGGPTAQVQKIGDGQGGLDAEMMNGDLFGTAVVALGDLNGDGLATELAVSAPGSDGGRGSVYVLFLDADGLVDSHVKIASGCTDCGFTAELSENSHFGAAVSTVTQRRGVDLLVSASNHLREDGSRGNAFWRLGLDEDGSVSTTTMLDVTGAQSAPLTSPSGEQCSDGEASAVGVPCVFPFTYEGTQYTECTTASWDQPWCSTDSEYDGNWGNCVNCVMPTSLSSAGGYTMVGLPGANAGAGGIVLTQTTFAPGSAAPASGAAAGAGRRALQDSLSGGVGGGGGFQSTNAFVATGASTLMATSIVSNPDRTSGGAFCPYYDSLTACMTEPSVSEAGVSAACFEAVGVARESIVQLTQSDPMPPECNQCSPMIEGPATVCEACEGAFAGQLEGCGPATMFSFGAAVASLGDINGDGFADLAVGDPERDDATGAAWLLLLGENGSVRHKQLVASGTSPGERLGAALAVVSGVGTRELVLAVGSPGDRRGPGPAESSGGVRWLDIKIEGFTTVLFELSDSSGNQASCTSRYFVYDLEPPVLSCDGLDVVGRTDLRKPYGTEAASSVELQYPAVSDNSGEALDAVSAVRGALPGTLAIYKPDYPFPYEGPEHDITTVVTMTATDSSGNADSCTLSVRILDEEPPVVDCHADLAISGATTDSGRLYGTLADGLSGLVEFPNVRENSRERINATAWVVSPSDSAPPDDYVPGDVLVPVTGGGAVELVSQLLDVDMDGTLDTPLRPTSRFPYSGRDGSTVTSLVFRAIDSAGNVDLCETTVTVAACKGFRSSVGCDEPGEAQLRTPAQMSMVGRVGREAFKAAVLATLTAADTSGSLQQEVVVTSYVQKVEAAVTMPGSVTTYSTDTESGTAARLQFRTGVAETVGVEVDLVVILSVSVSSSGRRRMQGSDGVQIDYEVTASEDVVDTFENSTFAESLADNINSAGDTISVDSSDVTTETGDVDTDIVFEVVTEVDTSGDGGSVDAGGLVDDMISDTSDLVSELNSGGTTVSGASAGTVSADSCTSGTTISNSDRTITNPCDGTTSESCTYTCNEGYSAFGVHVCGPDGSFVGGLCSPAGKAPFRCGTTGQVRYVKTATVSEAAVAAFEATGSTKKRYEATQAEKANLQAEKESLLAVDLASRDTTRLAAIEAELAIIAPSVETCDLQGDALSVAAQGR